MKYLKDEFNILKTINKNLLRNNKKKNLILKIQLITKNDFIFF